MPEPATIPQQFDTVKPFRPSEKPETRNPFTSDSEAAPRPGNMIVQELEAQILRIKGNLDDADRKNRLLLDEVYDLKRQLATDNTDIKLSHKEELYKMEREHDRKTRELEKEIADLKTENRFKDLERKQGERDGWTRIFDFFEENGSEFFTQVLAGLQNMGGPNPQQYTPQQLQAAFEQAAQYQEQQGLAGLDENTETQVSGGPDLSENPQQKPQNAQQLQFHPQNQQPTQLQMSQMKETLKTRLIDGAIAALTNDNANLEQYGHQVRSQLALFRQQGINLDVKAWTEMASVLAETAIEREITAERVANVVQPALDGVKQYGMFLKMVNPESATDQLFTQFNIQAGPPVRKLVTKVLTVIQNNL